MMTKQQGEPLTQFWHCPNCVSQVTTIYNPSKKNRPVKTIPTISQMEYELIEDIGTGEVSIDELKGVCSKCDQHVIFTDKHVTLTAKAEKLKDQDRMTIPTWLAIEFSIEDYRKAILWLMTGDHGTSSETILCIALGLKRHGFDGPYDFDDFGHCVKLVTMFPQLKTVFPEVCEKVPRFREWLENWDKKVAEFKDWAENTPWYRLALEEELIKQS